VILFIYLFVIRRRARKLWPKGNTNAENSANKPPKSPSLPRLLLPPASREAIRGWGNISRQRGHKFKRGHLGPLRKARAPEYAPATPVLPLLPPKKIPRKVSWAVCNNDWGVLGGGLV